MAVQPNQKDFRTDDSLKLVLAERLVEKIKQKAEELGRVPRLADFSFPTRFYAVFGSWVQALRAAGFPARQESLRLKTRYLEGQAHEVSEKECAEALRRLSELLGNCRPTTADVNSPLGMKAGCPSPAVISRKFGGLHRMLRIAGLSHLPTKREKARRDLEERFEKLLEGKPFLLSTDFTGTRAQKARLYRMARERGIPVVRLPRDRFFRIVLDWMRSSESGGALPSRAEIRSAMGKRAFKYLHEYCRGRTLREIAENEGLSRERVWQVLYRGARQAVETLTRKESD